MRVKNRAILGIACVLCIVGALVVFSPFNSQSYSFKGEKKVAPKKFSLVNVNNAPARELEKLPGIGEVKAAAIIAYRRSHGPFTCPEDLTKVKGIGKATVERLKNLITGYSTTSGVQKQANKVVNLNSASVEELESLPMIGPVKAKAIVEYRKTHGSFRSLYDLKKVKGIGDKTILKLKALVVTK